MPMANSIHKIKRVEFPPAIMDPVDKTFDTIYYYCQRATNAISGAAKVVTDTTNGALNVIANTITSSGQPSSESLPIPQNNTSITSVREIVKLLDEHRLVTSGVLGLVGLGVSGYLLKDSELSLFTGKKKRRALRLNNGARKDVVLVVGSVTEPLTRYIAIDLENRGFIVYITSTNSKADHKFFSNESVQDIKSLIVSDDCSTQAVDSNGNSFNSQQIHKFDFLLSSEHIPFQGAQPNKLNLVGIVFVPDLYFPAGKFHLIPETSWFQSFNHNALLSLNLLKNGLIGLAEKYGSNLIFITPTISSSLSLPYHSTENITVDFLQSLSTNLANDYDSLNITNLKLGALSINTNNNRKSFGIRGEPMKRLHYKLFDLLYSEHNNSVEYVGFGARFLAYFGRFIPRWLIANYFSWHFVE